MDWQGEGVLLAVRPLGESSAILDVMTEDRGRHAGVLRGAGSRRNAAHLQPGAQLALAWRARLEDQLGSFTFEPLRSRAPALMADRRALAGLSSVCALLARALPERDPQPALYRATLAMLDALGTVPDWPVVYLRWELGLLQAIGYGLDLDSCALTGATQGLAYVSPRTGRAVTREAAGPWADRLLPLPSVLCAAGGSAPVSPQDMAAGLALIGHFLTMGLCPDPDQRPLPEARARLVSLLSRA